MESVDAFDRSSAMVKTNFCVTASVRGRLSGTEPLDDHVA